MDKVKNLFFEDNTDKYVIGQSPNVLVYIMFVTLIGRFISDGRLYTLFDLLFFGAAFAWCYLEIRFGESTFRRILGSVVVIALLATRLY